MHATPPKQSLILRCCPNPDIPPAAFEKYDEETGQVFVEKTASILSSDDSNWHLRGEVIGHKTAKAALVRYRLRRWFGGASKVGSKSLKQTAVACAANSVMDLTLDAVRHLPRHLAHQLWLAISKRGGFSLQTWKIFSKILQQDEGPDLDLLRYFKSIDEPSSLELSHFVTPLISETFDFITFLTINTTFSVPGLISLVNLKNLGVLEVINEKRTFYDPAIRVSDRLVRDWHLAARDEGAFPVLRILRLIMHQDVTRKSLSFINAFPALAVYDVRGSSIVLRDCIEAENFGWTAAMGLEPLRFLEDLCVTRAVVTQDGTHGKAKRHGEIYGSSAGKRKLESIPRESLAQFLLRTRTELSDTSSDKIGTDNAKSRTLTATMSAAETKIPRVIWDADGIQTFRPMLSTADPWDIWELTKNREYARIGELRNDSDLARAGISISDQVVYGHEVLNSTPTASLTLGPRIHDLDPKYCSNGLAFIRYKSLSNEQERTGTDGTRKPKAGAEGSSTSKHRAQVPIPLPQPAVMRSKKRRLDDVLGSFA